MTTYNIINQDVAFVHLVQKDVLLTNTIQNRNNLWTHYLVTNLDFSFLGANCGIIKSSEKSEDFRAYHHL